MSCHFQHRRLLLIRADEILKDANVSNINRPLLSQPATTAVQIALVNLLSSWEIFPKSVVGHSSGEIAAAYASGALSLNDCMLIAYHRGVLSESLKSKRPERPGGMLAIGAPPTKVRPMIKRLGSARVAIACVNAPSLLTASGDERAILELQSAAEAENLFNRRLKVDVAYHSPHMQDIAEEYSDLLRGVDPQLQTKVKFHSSVKGKMLDTDTLDAEYWVENMTAPVQFLDGVQSLYKDGNGPDVLIELGPHSTLEAPIKDIMKANPGWSSTVRYLPTLVRNKDDTMTTMFLASALYALGVDIDLSAINQTDSTRTLRPLPDLPAYPWNHSKRYWHESRLSVNHQQKPFPYNDLLGDLVDDYNKYEPRWRNILRTVELPWLLDHKVQGSIIFPLTGYLAMALEAMLQYAAMWNIPVTSSTYYNLREITVSRSMVLSEESPTEISFILRPREEGSRNPSKSWYVFTVYSWTGENGWSEHCQGLLSLTQREQISSLANGSEQNNSSGDYYQGAISTRQEICQHTLEPSDIYSRFRRGGLQFGPGFQNITVARVAPNYSMATVTVPDAAKIMPKECERISCIHPETLDSCFQVTALAAGEGFLSSSDIHVPTFIKEFTLKVNTSIMPGQQLLVYANQQHLYGDNDSDIHSSFFAVSPQNQSDILIDVQGFTASKLPSQDAPEVSKGGRGLCYRVHYEPCADFLTPEQIKTVFSAHSKDIHPTRQTEGLEKAAFYYARRLLDDLSPEEVASAPEHLQKLHSALTSLLARSEQEGLPFQTQDWLQSTEEDRGQFLDEHATVDDCGRLLSAMGENLVPIFLEEVEPLSIMLRQNLLERYYRNSSINIRANESSAALISHLAHQNPNMKILEIGAGTGSSTMRILGALGHSFAEYIFTDISPSFFESAKDQQQEWSGKMRYQRLNIEEDPSAQGFEPESYDLILAYSVLHATANLERTMRNVRSLLRPGGKALIGEITLQQLSATVIFGCLPGKSRYAPTPW